MPIDQAPRVPDFLYGTAWKEERTPALTELAIRMGFRGIDTANQRRHYFEAGVGEGRRVSCGNTNPRGSVSADEIHLSPRTGSPAALRSCGQLFGSGRTIDG